MSDDERPDVRAFLGLDRLVHEPVRLAILTVLAEAQEVEFRFLEQVMGLTRGNLSSHASKLEEAGYIEVIKAFRGKVPVTSYRITEAGRSALAAYWAQLRSSMPDDGGKQGGS
jgi:DNA-binding transcriptional ArsR family regulator